MDETPHITLCSLNVERDKHIDLIKPFLAEQYFDVVCLVDIFKSDVVDIAKELGYVSVFTGARTRERKSGTEEVIGNSILSKFPISGADVFYYYNAGEGESYTPEVSRSLLWATTEKEGVHYTIGTTHFTWTPRGETDNTQRRDMEKLLKKTGEIGELIFCGDFNAPRGNAAFAMICEKYKDNIPLKYTTSIDGSMHRAGQLELMVDGLFTSPEYRAEGVYLKDGLSDHKAIIAKVYRK